MGPTLICPLSGQRGKVSDVEGDDDPVLLGRERQHLLVGELHQIGALGDGVDAPPPPGWA